jgi:MOSC domain-containing protein YiiM
MSGQVESVNTSRGGVPKESVFEALVTAHGVEGDRQHDLRFHGGLNRAVILYSLDVIRVLQSEGHPITIGSTGENLTISGVDWPALGPGMHLRIGGARLEITKYATPCRTIAQSFSALDFTRISQQQHPGWSRLCAKVLADGLVKAGDPVIVE